MRVRPLEGTDTPPSYLVLTAYDVDFTRGCGDDWVEDLEALEEYAREAGWSVSWGAEAAEEAGRRRLVRLVNRIRAGEGARRRTTTG